MSRTLSHSDRQLLLAALSDTPQLATVRGRQTLVRNALGGYPLSDEAEKALRWLHWEESPIVFADQLVQLLDGREPAPGVAALGLITQAVEPFVGLDHQEKLVELRRRMDWGADLDPAPSDQWRDRRSSADIVHERIIGENTLRHLYYLHQALRAAEAVVRLEVIGVGAGTGFLVGPDLLMTNHHVVGNAEHACPAERLPEAFAPLATATCPG